MSKRYIFSSESVTEGHPDKVCDTVSDAVVDACLEQDPRSRVACETFVKDNILGLAGEITTGGDINFEEVARAAVREIGYVHDDCKFRADNFFFMNLLGTQSPDIAQGVDESGAEFKTTDEQGAGDQGIMFGFACRETPQLMPMPIALAHALGREVTRMRKEEAARYPWLRPDNKTQVSIEYVDGVPRRITAVVVSVHHAASIDTPEIRAILKTDLIEKVLPGDMLDGDTEILINPTGRFVVGGPEGDAGLTGRKIIVDTYGGMGRHGGGAFSGKDPSKVDRSATYMCRYAAKNIVAAGLADKVEIQVAYAIGHPYPVSVHVDSFGTGQVADDKIGEAAREVFGFKPSDIICGLDLLRPIYGRSTNYGHFGREDAGLPWEKVNKVEALLAVVG